MNPKAKNVFQVHCPDCRAVLWIDAVNRTVIRSERIKKKAGSLDDMLDLEIKRKSEFERKFEATAELQKEKQKQAREKFLKALGDFGKDDPEK